MEKYGFSAKKYSLEKKYLNHRGRDESNMVIFMAFS